MKNRIRKNHTVLLLTLLTCLPAHAMKEQNAQQSLVPPPQILAAHACFRKLNDATHAGTMTEEEYAKHVQVLIKKAAPDDLSTFLHTPFDEPPLIKQKTWQISNLAPVGISGNSIAVADSNLVQFFPPDSDEPTSKAFTLPKEKNSKYLPKIERIAFSPCGRWLAALQQPALAHKASEPARIHLWNTASEKLSTLDVPDKTRFKLRNTVGLVFSPNGSRLAYVFNREKYCNKHNRNKYCESCWFNVWETSQPEKPRTFRHDYHEVRYHFKNGNVWFTDEQTLAHLENRFPTEWSERAKKKATSINLIDIQTERQRSAISLASEGEIKPAQVADSLHILAMLINTYDVLLWNTRESTPVKFSLQKPPPDAPEPSWWLSHPHPLHITFGPEARYLAVTEGQHAFDELISLYVLSPDYTKATWLWRIKIGDHLLLEPLCLTDNCLWLVDCDLGLSDGNEHRLSRWQPSRALKLRCAIAHALAEQEEERAQEKKKRKKCKKSRSKTHAKQNT